MRRLILPLTVLVFCSLSLAAAAADWPQFRGPDANGLSPETGINKAWAEKPPKLLWKVPMTDGGFSGPAVANGSLYILDHKGNDELVRALDAATGAEAWTFTYPDPGKANHGLTRATPLVHDGKVYTMGRHGLLHCFDEKTGKVLWSHDLVKDYGGKLPSWLVASSPIVDGEKLIICPAAPDGSVMALDRKTGETIWKGGGTFQMGYATPVIATIGGVKQYVVFAGKALTGVAADDGKLLWSFPWQTQYDVNAAAPIVMGDTVFITSDYGRGGCLVKIEEGAAKPVWENKEIQSHFSTGVVVDGYIYSTTDPGRLVCLDPKTGKVVWAQRGFQKGGLIGVDGTLIVVDGGNGDVAMCELSPKGYKELGRMKAPLGGQSWTAPVVAEGKLFIRNTKELAAFDLK